MNTFYSDSIKGHTVHLTESESYHCHIVLRNEIGDRIMVIDGTGGIYLCKIIQSTKSAVIANILRKELHSKNPYNIHLAIAPTKSQDRIEWFIEKAVELGVSIISFIKTNRTERDKINIDRANKIALSAVKQSGQYFLPKINDLSKFDQVISSRDENQLFIAHLEKENKRKNIIDMYKKNKDCCIMIGPEGDFTPSEIDLAKENNFISVTLGNTRLRTETAGIYVVSTIKTLNEQQ